MPMVARRYSDDEMRRILRIAAAADARAAESGPSGGGHTLTEIHDVAREAGIDPQDVDRAAAALEEPAATHTFLGFPLTLQKEVVLPRRLTPQQMRAVAAGADRTLGGAGSITERADSIQWHNEQKRRFVGVVSGEAGTRVRVISDQANGFVGVGAIGFVGSLIALNVLLNLRGPADLAIVAAIVVATYGGMRLYWSQRCRAAVDRIERFFDAVHALPRAP